MIIFVFPGIEGANTLNVIPAEMFSVARNYYVEPDNTVRVITNFDTHIGAARFLTTHNYSFTLSGGEYVISLGHTVLDEPGPRPVDADNAQEPAEEHEERYETEENNEDECRCAPEEPAQIAGSAGVATEAVSDELLLQILPRIIPGEAGSSIVLYNSKVREFNRMWNTVVSMKRQLDELMRVVEKNEMLNKIKEDIQYIINKCDIVESAGLAVGDNSELIINTKEVITAHGPRFGKRRIGRLQISIHLPYIYGSAIAVDNGREISRSFTIKNIDRNPEGWVCGHACWYNDVFSVCLGGYFNHLFEAVVSRNLPQFFDILMRLVQNPDERDAWGSKVQKFPEVIDEA